MRDELLRELVVATLKFLGAGALLSLFAGLGSYYVPERQSLPLAIAMACIPLAVVLIYSYPSFVTIWKFGD